MDTAITYFAMLLGFGVIIANALKKVKIPDTFFLLLAGLMFSPTLLNLVDVPSMGDIPDFLRLFALIIIVFAGSFNLTMREFKKVSEIATKLAFIGVLVTTILLGYFAHTLLGLDWTAAFLLGAIVSGTSSEVVFSFRRDLHEDDLNILKVESIANAPLCVLLPLIFLDFYVNQALPTTYLSKFWLMMAGGVGTGVIIGFLAYKAFMTAEKEFSPLFSAALALVTYAMAVNAGGSGILAVAIAGLIAGNHKYPNKQAIRQFEDTLSSMLRISVLMLLGASITMTMPTVFELAFIAVALFAIRPFAVLLSYLGKAQISKERFKTLSLVAPRGIAAAAMAPLVLAYGLPGADMIVKMVFLMILVSVFSSSVAAKYLTPPPPKNNK